jgi:hypothetical protein
MKVVEAKVIINIIEEAIDKRVTATKLCVIKKRAKNFVANYVHALEDRLERKVITQEDYDSVTAVWNRYLSVKDSFNVSSDVKEKPLEFDSMTPQEKVEAEYDAYDDDNYDDRSKGEAVRESEEQVMIRHTFSGTEEGTLVNKISGYSYHIMIKGEPDLIGELTREEMDMVYRLYSNLDGAGLTQRTLSRQLGLAFRDFKRIIRAFNITKQSIPVAPHIIEENNQEHVIDLIFRNKENNLLKKIELDRSKKTEQLLKDAQKELVDLKSKFKDWESLINNLNIDDIEPFEIKFEETDGEKALVVFLSDQHVGAHTKEESIYDNDYNEKEFNNRMIKTLEMVRGQLALYGRFDRIFIVNLGDALDGFNGQTTRGGHGLPQNLNNRGQFNVYLEGMIKFFETLYEMDAANNIDYYCVGDDNHSGDFGFFANKALEIYLSIKFPNMVIDIFDKFIGTMEYGDHMYILSHGKDKEDKKHGFKLELNPATENFFNEYVHRKNIKNKHITVACGDLHQSLTQHAKRFRWKRVLSMYGASKWIHTNFGFSRAGLNYEVIDKNKEEITEGIIWFN